MYLIGSSCAAFFFGILNTQARMMMSLNIASISILPDGEVLRLLMFNGKVMDTPIRDVLIHRITPKKIELRIIVRTRPFRVQIDNNDALMK